MGEISRGQDVTIQVFDNDGAIVAILNPTSYSANLDSDEERQVRLGEREETPRQVIHGYSGNMGFEEEGPILDDIQDAQVARYTNGETVYTIDILETTYYPKDGTERTYVYPDAVFKITKDASDKNSPNERSVEWTSKLRRRV
jgi:hypothetical protein